MLETLTEGQRPEEKPTMWPLKTEVDGLGVKTGIPLYSLGEHHLRPFHGVAHIAYHPEESMVDLSKLARSMR
ncbi:GTP cyclohydrolase I [Haladaptatus halobius]|uniref:GTP cyclohydrolase I n=1 Tax=Haladaptatus halobius TaxID=2884875 RepID=UPI001D09B28F|nr:GTP cyclohydrolase I [Haladaptatus halobius]